MAAVKQITEVDGRKTSIALGNNHVALRAVSCTAVVFFNVGIHLSIVQGVWLRPVDCKAPPRLVPVAIVLDERTCPHLFTLAADFRFPALGCLGFVDVALAVYHNVFVVVVQAKQRLRIHTLLKGVRTYFGVVGGSSGVILRSSCISAGACATALRGSCIASGRWSRIGAGLFAIFVRSRPRLVSFENDGSIDSRAAFGNGHLLRIGGIGAIGHAYGFSVRSIV